MRPLHKRLLLVTLAGIAACLTPTDSCGCSPPPPSDAQVVVVGMVTDMVGAPVVAARVAFDGVPPTMSIDPPIAPNAPAAVTDADGRFATRAVTRYAPGEQVLRAAVVRAGSTDTVRRRLDVADFRSPGSSLDTVRLTLAVP